MNGFEEEIEHVLVRTITKVKCRISEREREDGAMCDPAMQAGLSSVLIPITPSVHPTIKMWFCFKKKRKGVCILRKQTQPTCRASSYWLFVGLLSLTLFFFIIIILF